MVPRCPTLLSSFFTFSPTRLTLPNGIRLLLILQSTTHILYAPLFALAPQSSVLALPEELPKQPKGSILLRNLTTTPRQCFATVLNLQDNVQRWSAGSKSPSALQPEDTMTVTLVPHPGNMPGYNNSVDLDEVQSLSRYCFLLIWRLASAFISCCSRNPVLFLQSRFLPPGLTKDFSRNYGLP